MTEIQYVAGDLVQMADEGEFDLIFHGANCMNTMGSGVAEAIAKRFSKAVGADNTTVPGDLSKLGTYSSTGAKIGADKSGKRNGQYFTIVNLYTQYGYEIGGKRFCPYAFMKSLDSMLDAFYDPNLRIGFPLIGSDRGGGRWEEIEATIFSVFNLHADRADNFLADVTRFPNVFEERPLTCVVLPGTKVPGRGVIS